VHIRAFVAGSGDIRRIPQIVSEVFTEKKLPLPSVSVILIGGLRLENAQVVLEAVSLAKKDVNPGGLEFVAGEPSTASDPAVSPQPLLEKTLAQLASRVNPAAVVQVSCFVSTMTSPAELTAAVSVRFPSAAVDLVQTQRAPWQALANCEVVVRGGKATAAKLAFTGTRVAFGRQEKDATLAFQRLDRDLNDVLAPAANIVFSNVYTLSPQAGAMVKKIRPAAATLPVEGLASIEAGFAVDAIAVVSP
jgi:hypothetical protein